jgi:hypothetical protein
MKLRTLKLKWFKVACPGGIHVYSVVPFDLELSVDFLWFVGLGLLTFSGLLTVSGLIFSGPLNFFGLWAFSGLWIFCRFGIDVGGSKNGGTSRRSTCRIWL